MVDPVINHPLNDDSKLPRKWRFNEVYGNGFTEFTTHMGENLRTLLWEDPIPGSVKSSEVLRCPVGAQKGKIAAVSTDLCVCWELQAQDFPSLSRVSRASRAMRIASGWRGLTVGSWISLQGCQGGCDML